MKELTIEQKDQRYDEALERYKAKQEYESKEVHKFIEYIFPELKESEDERIRKAILGLVRQSSEILEKKNQKQMIAWLEKQGEQKAIDKVEPKDYSSIDPHFAKPIDKVKTKFKVGDWVVYDGWVCQIIDVTEDGYCNSKHGFIPKDREDSMRLWTIADAKDGDVLTYSDSKHTWLCIFKELKNQRCYDYCSYSDKDVVGFWPRSNWNYDKTLSYKPATKEQRDLLFQKMEEAGYEWDSGRKELKKHTPKHKVGDTIYYNSFGEVKSMIVANVTTDGTDNPMYEDENGNAVFEKDLIEQTWSKPGHKQEWSEECRDYYDAIITKLEVTQDDALLTDNQMEFLKSLKERYTWKPSDKQMEVLWKYAEQNNYDGFILTSLHEQLKKLREE